MCGEKYFGVRRVFSLLVYHGFSSMGLYVALFCGSIYMLVYRRQNRFHLFASVALFLLTAAYMGVVLAIVIGEPLITANSSVLDGNTVGPCMSGASERLHEAVSHDLLNIVSMVIETCTFLIADGILIYRCVVLWPRRIGRWIGLVLGVLLLAEAGTGFGQGHLMAEIYSMERSYTVADEGILTPQWIAATNALSNLSASTSALILAVNAAATVITASRIWFLARQLEKTLGSGAGVRYRAPISMIVESGLMISASQLVETCTSFIDSVIVYADLINNLSQMLLVIAPTLIILRVGLGKGFDSVVETAHGKHASRSVHDKQITSIRFAEPHTTTTDASHLASLGGFVFHPRRESDGDSQSTHSGSSGLSDERIPFRGFSSPRSVYLSHSNRLCLHVPSRFTRLLQEGERASLAGGPSETKEVREQEDDGGTAICEPGTGASKTQSLRMRCFERSFSRVLRVLISASHRFQRAKMYTAPPRMMELSLDCPYVVPVWPEHAFAIYASGIVFLITRSTYLSKCLREVNTHAIESSPDAPMFSGCRVATAYANESGPTRLATRAPAPETAPYSQSTVVRVLYFYLEGAADALHGKTIPWIKPAIPQADAYRLDWEL
ncbi:hypothetical protein DENSPDRAFT_853240 [Dentipellis sp. KUC8613]|nr:hypothetical protein DENSPDRAFT_853240 [Dentipellis sp. KUC8613]